MNQTTKTLIWVFAIIGIIVLVFTLMQVFFLDVHRANAAGTTTVVPTTVTYGVTDGVELQADIYATPGIQNAPVVIMIHGGAWARGSRLDMWKAATILSQKGFVAMPVDYQLACKDRTNPLCFHFWPQPVWDVQLAIDWAKANIASYGGDPNHINLLGSSAGADIALEVAVDGVGIDKVAVWSPPVGFEGCTDICTPMQRYIRCAQTVCPNSWHQATVAYKVRPLDPPTIVFNSTDEQIPLWMPQQYVDAMNANGVPNEFIVLPGTRHAQGYQMNRLPDGLTVLDHTAAFLAKTNVQPTPGVKSRTGFDIGFRVTTIRPTNVLAKWRVTCTNGGIALVTRGKVRGMSPLTKHLAPSIKGAESCRLRVVAWDVPPHVKPHDWPAPVVTTWVDHA